MKKNLKGMTSNELRALHRRALNLQKEGCYQHARLVAFIDNYLTDIAEELNERNYKVLINAAKKYTNIDPEHFAKSAMNEESYWPTNDTYEIDAMYAKRGHSEVVLF